MSETFIELTEDQFDEQFPLVTNHLNPNAGWTLGEGGGCLFETYGEQLDFIQEQDPSRVWTFVNGDDGDVYVINGFDIENGMGFLLSRDPVLDNTSIEVRIPMEFHDEWEEGEHQL